MQPLPQRSLSSRLIRALLKMSLPEIQKFLDNTCEKFKGEPWRPLATTTVSNVERFTNQEGTPLSEKTALTLAIDAQHAEAVKAFLLSDDNLQTDMIREAAMEENLSHARAFCALARIPSSALAATDALLKAGRESEITSLILGNPEDNSPGAGARCAPDLAIFQNALKLDAFSHKKPRRTATLLDSLEKTGSKLSTSDVQNLRFLLKVTEGMEDLASHPTVAMPKPMDNPELAPA